MTANPFLKSDKAEDFRLSLGRLWSYFTATDGNTVKASVTATTANSAFKIFLESGSGADSGAEATVDANNGFGTLDVDAAPAVIGFIGVVGDALQVYGLPIFTKISGDMTAFVHTLCGASSTGVTATNKNIAFTTSFTTMNLLAADTTVQKWAGEVFYQKS
jgi:hypothetical protein